MEINGPNVCFGESASTGRLRATMANDPIDIMATQEVESCTMMLSGTSTRDRAIRLESQIPVETKRRYGSHSAIEYRSGRPMLTAAVQKRGIVYKRYDANAEAYNFAM
jgi:hypothetical protein